MKTKLKRISELSKEHPYMKFNSIGHLINYDMLMICHNRMDGSKAIGVDGINKETYSTNLDENLKHLVQRLKDKSYKPKPARRVEIPKDNGKTRPLSIYTYEDKLVQEALREILEAIFEPHFYENMQGFRPNRNCHGAIRKLNTMMEDGTIVPRTSGTPQGGVISPVLANLFLHYVFDDFMVKEFPSIPWARYADDVVTHCASLKQAKYLQRRIQERFATFGLELNLEKTRIVYCKDEDRKGKHENTSFDFLGYTFRPRHAKNKYGKLFTNFLPAMGEKAKKAIRKEVRGWKLQLKPDKDLWDIANMFNKQIQGWINYYTHFDVVQ